MSLSGEEFTIESHGYRAVITEAGATLRLLQHAGRDLIVGHGAGAMATAGRGQHLIPWPNRIRDGRYTFAGRSYQLPISEPARTNASHGLTRWAAWVGVQESSDCVRMLYPMMAQPGYPWALDLAVSYQVDEDGLAVVVQAHNVSDTPAPFAYGAHPYLTAGTELIDDAWLCFAAREEQLVDPERMLPTGTRPVAGTEADFATARRIGDQRLDTAFGLDSPARVTLRDDSGVGVELWGDASMGWLQIYTADSPPIQRSGLAVEPMTAPPDAFNSGTDLVVLQPGQRHACQWGIRALG